MWIVLLTGVMLVLMSLLTVYLFILIVVLTSVILALMSLLAGVFFYTDWSFDRCHACTDFTVDKCICLY